MKKMESILCVGVMRSGVSFLNPTVSESIFPSLSPPPSPSSDVESAGNDVDGAGNDRKITTDTFNKVAQRCKARV